MMLLCSRLSVELTNNKFNEALQKNKANKTYYGPSCSLVLESKTN